MDLDTHNKQKDVSVIIAVYNAGQYITRAIDSALHQQGVDLEVVVVDDASTDDTWSQLQKIRDSRLTVMRNEQNYGPSVTRNKAIEQAKGQWLAVLDADDAFAPGRLARLKNIAERHQADIVCDNLSLCDNSGEQLAIMYPQGKDTPSTISLEHFIAKSSGGKGRSYGYLKPFINNSFVKTEKLSYQAEINIGEDYLLMTEALAKGANCVFDHTPSYYYTQREDSISKSLSVKDIEKLLQADNTFEKRYQLDCVVKSALSKRRHYLQKMCAQKKLSEAIKSKSFMQCILLIVAHPSLAKVFILSAWRNKLKSGYGAT